jgi:predicted ATPase
MTVDRFILTGPPGSGKTSIIRQLAEDGFATVEEAATDLIAAWQRQGIDEPRTCPSFVDAIVETQRDRQINLGNSARIQFYDRSPICTLALANWLGRPVSDALRFEIERIRRERFYRPEVFFVRSLGFVTPTEARRFSLADSIRFGELHEEAYSLLASNWSTLIRQRRCRGPRRLTQRRKPPRAQFPVSRHRSSCVVRDDRLLSAAANLCALHHEGRLIIRHRLGRLKRRAKRAKDWLHAFSGEIVSHAGVKPCATSALGQYSSRC